MVFPLLVVVKANFSRGPHGPGVSGDLAGEQVDLSHFVAGIEAKRQAYSRVQLVGASAWMQIMVRIISLGQCNRARVTVGHSPRNGAQVAEENVSACIASLLARIDTQGQSNRWPIDRREVFAQTSRYFENFTTPDEMVPQVAKQTLLVAVVYALNMGDDIKWRHGTLTLV